MRQFLNAVWLNRLLLLMLLALAGAGILRKHVSFTPGGERVVSSDVLAYVSAAGNLLDGQNMYLKANGEGNSYVYPPFLAVVCIPLVFVDPLVVDILWFILNVILIGVILRQSFFLFSGEAFSSLSRGSQWALSGFAIVLSLRYLIRNAQDANINIVVLCLIVTALYLAETSRNPAWAGLIGIAAAIKVLPAIFILYFIARRQWKAALWLGGVFVAATVLPMLITGWGEWVKSMNTFVAYSQSQLSPRGIEIENFSLWGFVGRLLSHNVAFLSGGGVPYYINVADLSLSLLRSFVTVVNIALLMLLYAVERRNTMEQKGIRNGNGGVVLFLLGMNLVSILTEDHHTVSFMVAYVFVYVYGMRKERWDWVWNTALATGAFSIVLSHDVVVPLLGKTAYNVLLSYSLPLLPIGLVLFLVVLLADRKAVPQSIVLVQSYHRVESRVEE